MRNGEKVILTISEDSFLFIFSGLNWFAYREQKSVFSFISQCNPDRCQTSECYSKCVIMCRWQAGINTTQRQKRRTSNHEAATRNARTAEMSIYRFWIAYIPAILCASSLHKAKYYFNNNTNRINDRNKHKSAIYWYEWNEWLAYSLTHRRPNEYESKEINK